MKFEPEQQHRRSLRLAGYDYTQQGAYFVTICVKRKRAAFGQIDNGVMQLNRYGRMVQEEWDLLSERYDYVTLDEFVIMPNHIHLIIVICDVGAGSSRPDAPSLGREDPAPTSRHTLGQILAYFKYQSTKRVNAYRAEQNLAPVQIWQRNYFERIIRDEKELDATRRYILENPLCWNDDAENPAKLKNSAQTIN